MQKIIKAKRGLECGSSGRAPTQHRQGLSSNPVLPKEKIET
jgi:hypothetical protein